LKNPGYGRQKLKEVLLLGYPIPSKCVELDYYPEKVKSYTLTKEELKAFNKRLNNCNLSPLETRDHCKKVNITKAQLAAELKEGTPIQDIAKLYNVKRSTVVTYIKRWNL